MIIYIRLEHTCRLMFLVDVYALTENYELEDKNFLNQELDLVAGRYPAGDDLVVLSNFSSKRRLVVTEQDTIQVAVPKV